MSAERTKHSVGWLCGVIVFWALTAWMVVVGLSSLIPQIFWPAQAAAGSSRGCLGELRELQQELMAHAARDIEKPAETGAAEAQNQWFVSFDERLKNTGTHCAQSEQGAFEQLVKVRHAIEAFSERWQREEAPRLRELDRLLREEVRSGSPK